MDDTQPELVGWHENLTESLRAIDSAFRATSKSPHLQQKAVLQALLSIAEHLRALPGVREHLGPINALIHAIDSAITGSAHPLLESHIKKAGGRTLTESQMVLQGQSVALVTFLCAAGYREGEARTVLAKLLVKAGVKGSRHKKPITALGLLAWCNNVRSGMYPEVAEYTKISELTMRQQLEVAGKWPPDRQDALVFVERITGTRRFLDTAAAAAGTLEVAAVKL